MESTLASSSSSFRWCCIREGPGSPQKCPCSTISEPAARDRTSENPLLPSLTWCLTRPAWHGLQVGALTTRFEHFDMIHYGSYLSALSPFWIVAFPAHGAPLSP